MQQDDALASAEAAIELGRLARNRGDYTQARACYLKAVAILRTEENPLRLAHTIRHVGDILCNEGKHSDALPHFEEALAMYRAYPSVPELDLANALRGFALAEQQVDHRDHAIQLWREARDLYAAVFVQPGVEEANTRLEVLEATRRGTPFPAPSAGQSYS